MCWAASFAAVAGAVAETGSSTWMLRPQAEVDARGVFLYQVITSVPEMPLPHVRLGDAPAFGKELVWTRAQVVHAVRAAAPEAAGKVWAGAERVRIGRRTRLLGETELVEHLTALLQSEQVRDQGELELRLTRAWDPVEVADERLTVKLLQMPAAGVSAFFIVRFEVLAGEEVLGNWQASLKARIWRDVWVSRSPLVRGDLLGEAALDRARRDVLSLHGTPLGMEESMGGLEMAQNVPAGMPLFDRMVRKRPVVTRGQVIDAQMSDGVMLITLKVEALESGAPGEVVRVRNVQTKREFRGKVYDEQTVQVVL